MPLPPSLIRYTLLCRATSYAGLMPLFHIISPYAIFDIAMLILPPLFRPLATALTLFLIAARHLLMFLPPLDASLFHYSTWLSCFFMLFLLTRRAHAYMLFAHAFIFHEPSSLLLIIIDISSL